MSHKMKICTYVLICRVEIVLSVYVVNQGIDVISCKPVRFRNCGFLL